MFGMDTETTNNIISVAEGVEAHPPALDSLDDIARLRESVDLECKLAAGANDNGCVPKDLWPTYSAFANTHGGVIVLGLRERAGRFVVHGVEEADRVTRDLFNTVNNPRKVSVNLLSDASVRRVVVDGKTLIVIEVPAASRKQKPVYVNGNPLQVYRRLHDGDRHCAEETVRRMFAEQVHDTRDSLVCDRFTLADVDLESLHAYRNLLGAHKLKHPWSTLGDLPLLRALGGWNHDRARGEKGLTLAGLLMFGQWPSIHEVMPNYFVDYQEHPSEDERLAADLRWLDRVVPDGTWSGNLFDFYFRTVRKLTADLKVPFVLKDNIRQDDTPLHKALREALVNTLVHADFTDRASVLVIKKPSGFVFRNPGVLRVPAVRALQGGESDCRNRTMQQMFLMIGLGERAGSGLVRIQRAWAEAGGKLRLTDSFEPYDQTRLEMDLAASDLGALTGKTLGKTLGETPGKTPMWILDLLRKQPTLSIPEIAKTVGRSESSVERAIRALKSAGKLSRVGPAKGGSWRVIESD
jgi:ATP-dependent DNA helicase RecG